MKAWYPFSQEFYENEKISIVSAKDEYLIDKNGEKYIDLISSWWTCFHGHCNKKIANAIAKQSATLDHTMFTDFSHNCPEELVRNIDLFTNNHFARCFFSDNGSTSVEVAIKIAHQYWKNVGENRNIILSFEGGYHGDTLGAMSLGKKSDFFKPFEDLMCNVEFLPYPENWIHCEDVEKREAEVIQIFEKKIAQYKNKISCIILEPLIQGASGMKFSRPEFLEEIVKIAKNNDIIVIFDEIMTGFYRTGKIFAYNHIEEKPDILCLSKAITGGFLPLGITCVTSKIYDAFYSNDNTKTFLHGHSYTANPIICAAANASFAIMKSTDISGFIDKISKIYQDFIPRFQEIRAISKIRTMGLIFAFDFEKLGGYGDLGVINLKQQFLNERLNIRPLGKIIYLLPPYCISKENLVNSLNKMINIIQNS